MEKIICTNHLRKKEVCRVKEERNILQTVQRREADRFDPILGNMLWQEDEEDIKTTQLPEGNEAVLELEEEALDHPLQST